VVPEPIGSFVFTEGPVGAADGTLYFTVDHGKRAYRLDPDGKLSVFRDNIDHGNGLALTRQGELLFAERTRVSKRTLDGTIVTLTDSFQGKPFADAVNDLIADVNGGVYFTVPGLRPIVPGRPTFVFYLPPGAREPLLIDSAIARPNGLTLTGDGRTLVVDDTLSSTVFAYDVAPDGTVRNKRAFINLVDIPPGKESGADGIAIDREGRFYIATVVGVEIFDAAGKYLGRIRTEETPTNVAFAGSDKRTLYVTAHGPLYRIKVLAQGPERLGK
jgi:gluconolactonase